MGKLKKKIKKKVNPEKSNKMIYAVGAGLLILASVFIYILLSGESSVDKKDVMTNSLAYLKGSAGIKELKPLPEQNKLVIVYDSSVDQTGNRKKDFFKIARYAGIRISNKIDDLEITVQLCKDKEEQTVYTVVLKNGGIVRETAGEE